MKNSILIILLLILNFGAAHAQAGDYFQEVPVWTDLKEALKTPKAIRRLDLSKTKLKKVPAEVFELYNLEELMLGKNQITEIPADIKKLKKLRVLDLSRNKLDEIPREIGMLKNLEKLDLGRNNIFSLPDEIGNCESLEILLIWDNNIGMLPESMKRIPNLKQIDMRNIMISDPAQFMMQDMLPGVKILFTSNCNCGPNL